MGGGGGFTDGTLLRMVSGTTSLGEVSSAGRDCDDSRGSERRRFVRAGLIAVEGELSRLCRSSSFCRSRSSRSLRCCWMRSSRCCCSSCMRCRCCRRSSSSRSLFICSCCCLSSSCLLFLDASCCLFSSSLLAASCRCLSSSCRFISSSILFLSSSCLCLSSSCLLSSSLILLSSSRFSSSLILLSSSRFLSSSSSLTLLSSSRFLSSSILLLSSSSLFFLKLGIADVGIGGGSTLFFFSTLPPSFFTRPPDARISLNNDAIPAGRGGTGCSGLSSTGFTDREGIGGGGGFTVGDESVAGGSGLSLTGFTESDETGGGGGFTVGEEIRGSFGCFKVAKLGMGGGAGFLLRCETDDSVEASVCVDRLDRLRYTELALVFSSSLSTGI